MTQPTLLVVDDERNVREGLARFLRRHYAVLTAESGAAALALLAQQPVDVVLSDIRMPGMDGLELLAAIRAKFPSVIVLMLTAYGDIENAVRAMKEGARDYLSKPVDFEDLALRINRELRARELEEKSRAMEAENRSLRRQLDKKFGMENIVGTSPAMEAVYDIVRAAAPSQATVLIQGPSGTGKELIAHAIHQLSPRADKPFVAVHCAALSPELLESELFGHEKGAFTGAIAQRKGRFELADGGTLFLDEIGEIDASVQIKLLRVLEERAFERVGGTETLHVDIRIVAATNRDLRQRVAEGHFREDLFYRLAIVDIQMPPLRERVADIPVLFAHFLQEMNAKNGKAFESVSSDAMDALQRYDWPGNVRELRNTVERMVVLGSGSRLELEHVPRTIREPIVKAENGATTPVMPVTPAPAPAPAVPVVAVSPMPAAPVVVPATSLADAEKAQILAVLEACGGNRSAAAQRLGISRRTLHRKLAAWGIQKFE